MELSGQKLRCSVKKRSKRGIYHLRNVNFRLRDVEVASSNLVTSTKKQPKTSYFDLFSAVFLYIFHEIGCFQLTTCLPYFFGFYWIFHLLFLNLFENPFSLVNAIQKLKADSSFFVTLLHIQTTILPLYEPIPPMS